jgi:hypothetical protein
MEIICLPTSHLFPRAWESYFQELPIKYNKWSARRVMGHAILFPRADRKHFQEQKAGISMRYYFHRTTVGNN